MDVLDGLDALDWAALQVAFGPADGVPALVRQLVAEDADSRAAAVEELFGTVWHQGTVYEGTRFVVPFLAAVVADPDGDDGTRAQVALLLACIASATSFSLPHQPQEMVQPGWLRKLGADTPSRDLTVECRAAVTVCATVLVGALPQAPPATTAALVATLAATTPGPGSATLTALCAFEDDRDPRLVTAARVARLSADDALTDEDLIELSAVDDEATDHLSSIADWPVPMRAVELVRELAERVVAERLRSPVSFTYPEVGATAAELPVGYQHLHASRDVGAGRELFEQCAETVMTWGIQRGAGLTVIPGDRVRVGAEHSIGLRLGPLRTRAPCRVVYVVDEPDRKGFAYGTLPGHPECGEESFIVSLEEDGAVRFAVTAFSRPARWLARLGGPITGFIQRRVTRRYLDAVHP